LIGCLLLIWSTSASGRQLNCSYDTDSNVLWSKYNRCVSKSVDLSESFKTTEHSFSGTAEQKSAATVVSFNEPSQIDFIPKQIFNDFPKLNGLQITGCKSLKTVNDNLLTKDFGAIQYLDLYENKIETIEANAFQHLTKLKWISLAKNQIRSLPQQIFKNNPELFLIFLYNDEINSIPPDFFKNLRKLQFVSVTSNQCIDKDFGCKSGSCLISHSELDSGISTCYNNCLTDVVCASKSGKLDKLSSEQIEKNLDLIISSGHVAALIEKGYSSLLFERGYGYLLCKEDNKAIKSELESVKQELAALKTITERIKN
jgi:hypothetical protein